ncbi:MAG: hypothetical protein AAF997_18765 [Myxococcota bacterium]
MQRTRCRNRSSGWKLGVTAILLMGVMGCPPAGENSPSPASPCTTRYAQCKLPDGPLGVCNDTPCAEGQEPPCLKCISQH